MNYKIYTEIKRFLATLDLEPQTYEDLIKAIAGVLGI